MSKQTKETHSNAKKPAKKTFLSYTHTHINELLLLRCAKCAKRDLFIYTKTCKRDLFHTKTCKRDLFHTKTCKRDLFHTQNLQKRHVYIKRHIHVKRDLQTRRMQTGWRRPIGCLKLQVFFRKRATKLIETNPSPRWWFLSTTTMFPDQEPRGRRLPSKHLVQILRGGSSSSGFVIREHSKSEPPPGGGVLSITMFPNQEPRGRGPPWKFLVQSLVQPSKLL